MAAETKYRVNAALLRARALTPEPPREGAGLHRREAEALEKAAELTLRPPACYLVTGYRGAGKSTFINLLARASGTPGQAVAVVTVNGAIPGKDEDRPRLLLRKMQRNLYEAARHLIPLLPGPVARELELAYLQTSYTVSHKVTTSWQMALALEAKGWLRAGALTAVYAAVLEALPFVSPRLAAWWQSITAISYPAAALIAALLAGITPALAAEFRRKGEREVALRYDDEVAETTFIALLERLSTTPVKERSPWHRRTRWLRAAWARLFARRLPPLQPLKLVFVIDELDKLGSGQFSAMVDGLKPVLMCGHAHFLLVAGMEEYGHWHSGLYAEDDRFVGHFNAHFAIPALGDEELKRLFAQLLVDPKEADDGLMRPFRDYLILESRGRPRRFLTEFSRYVRWRPQPALSFTV
ncbi:MAG TPA: hypothetical protein VD902_20005, partial [Symbiobacteriaceae bacterium]|nr:hypothetical protein [Symbiobacteriaceae bacterium]